MRYDQGRPDMRHSGHILILILKLNNNYALSLKKYIYYWDVCPGGISNLENQRTPFICVPL